MVFSNCTGPFHIIMISQRQKNTKPKFTKGKPKGGELNWRERYTVYHTICFVVRLTHLGVYARQPCVLGTGIRLAWVATAAEGPWVWDHWGGVDGDFGFCWGWFLRRRSWSWNGRGFVVRKSGKRRGLELEGDTKRTRAKLKQKSGILNTK